MTETAHLECPFVECGSSDAFSFNHEKGVGKCHSCGNGYPSVRPQQSWAKERYKPVEGKDYREAKVMNPKISKSTVAPCRGITKETMEKFGIITGVDDSGKHVAHKYVYPSGKAKYRNLLDKSFYAEAGFKADSLFGMNLFPAGLSKTLTICEGELDAASAWQMIASAKYDNAVVSVPAVNPSSALWTSCREYINSFSKIIVSPDTGKDDPGMDLANRLGNMFPNKVYIMQHGQLKDANDFLTKGRETEFKNLWWNAIKYTPENVINSTAQFLDLYRNSPKHNYTPTGIQALDDVILGLMQGHFTVIKAATGQGKTEMFRLLQYNLLKQGVPIAAWHLEETKLRTILGLASYELGKNVTRRDIIEDQGLNDEVEGAISRLTEDENFFQFYMSDGDDTEKFIDQIKFFHAACDCKFVFFEPIQDVIAGSATDSKESILTDLSVRLSNLAAELNIGIVTIAHTNDDGAPKYCKMIAQKASVLIDLYRDKDSEDLDEKNTTYINVEKNRPCSTTGPAGSVKFDPKTFTLTARGN